MVHNVIPLETEKESWEVDNVLDGNQSLNASVPCMPLASQEERNIKYKTSRKLTLQNEENTLKKVDISVNGATGAKQYFLGGRKVHPTFMDL